MACRSFRHSQLDTFDYKPELEKRHGEQVDLGIRAAATSTPGPLMKSPFPWRQHGESGRWVTDQFPHLAGWVDELAFLMAQTSRTNVHGPASYLQTTGFLLPGMPCCGAWVGYALGRLTDELPTFVVLPDPRELPYNGMGNFSAGFLPPPVKSTNRQRHSFFALGKNMHFREAQVETKFSIDADAVACACRSTTPLPVPSIPSPLHRFTALPLDPT